MERQQCDRPPRLAPGIKIGSALLAYSGLAGLINRVADTFWMPRGVAKPFYVERRPSPCFQVLTYHRVHPFPSPFMIDAISPAAFENQIACLSKAFNVLTVDEIVRRIRQEKPLPPRCLAITFDDGYADNYVHAYPILRKYSVPATFFIATGYIGNGKVFWFDQILRAFQSTGVQEVKISSALRAVPLTTVQQRGDAATHALFYLRSLPTNQLDAAMDEIFHSLKVTPAAESDDLMLTWSNVSDMANGGYCFGSHTVTHPILSQMPLQEAEKEILRSKQMIEENLSRSVTMFAYPSGRPEDFSGDIQALVQKAGYHGALSTSFAINSIRTNPYRLNRMRPWEQYWPVFLVKLCAYKMFQTGEEFNNPAEDTLSGMPQSEWTKGRPAGSS